MVKEEELYNRLTNITKESTTFIPDPAAGATAEDWNNSKFSTQRELYKNFLNIDDVIQKNDGYAKEVSVMFSDIENRLTKLEDNLLNGTISGDVILIRETFSNEYDLSSTTHMDKTGQYISLGINNIKEVDKRTITADVKFNNNHVVGLHTGIGQKYGLSTSDEIDDLKKMDTAIDIVNQDSVDIEQVIKLNDRLASVYDPEFEQIADRSLFDTVKINNLIASDPAIQRFMTVKFDWKELHIPQELLGNTTHRGPGGRMIRMDFAGFNYNIPKLDITYELTFNPVAYVSSVILEQMPVHGEYGILYQVTVENEDGKVYPIQLYEDKKKTYTHLLTGDRVRTIRWFFKRNSGYKIPLELMQYNIGPISDNRFVVSV